MRKHFLGVLVGFFTFGVGLMALYLSFPAIFPDSRISVDVIPQPIESACSSPATFPGRSRLISGLKRAKVGYFPSDSFPREFDGRDGWYAKHLRVLGEPSLLDRQEAGAQVYRFLWLRTFHHPIYVRIENAGGDVSLSMKELGGAGGYEPGKVVRSREIKLDQEVWCEFMSRLDRASFWRLPTDDNDAGNDGAQWILEGVRDGQYHIVDRWSPIYARSEREDCEWATNATYSEACIYLLKLSGVDIDALKGDLY